MNQQLSMNARLPNEKDTYFSMFCGMHLISFPNSAIFCVMWRIIALQVMKYNRNNHLVWINPGVVQIAVITRYAAILSTYVTVVPDGVPEDLLLKRAPTKVPVSVLRCWMPLVSWPNELCFHQFFSFSIEVVLLVYVPAATVCLSMRLALVCAWIGVIHIHCVFEVLLDQVFLADLVLLRVVVVFAVLSFHFKQPLLLQLLAYSVLCLLQTFKEHLHCAFAPVQQQALCLTI